MTASAECGATTALNWSLMAVNDATDQVNNIATSDLPRRFAAIGGMLRRPTIGLDTLCHHHAADQDAADLMPPEYELDLELDHAHVTALVGQKIWQPSMLATGFVCKELRMISSEVEAA